MRVVVISPLFPPEPVVSGQTSAQIAQALVERRHEVTVITAYPSRPAGILFSGYSRRLLRRTKEAGLTLVRCFTFLSARSSMGSRFLENISFGLMSGFAVLVARKADVIYANTWPVVAAGILSVVSRLRHIPIVLSIQDVYPESLVSQRRIHANGWLAGLIRWIDGWIVSRCQSVIVISESFARIYSNNRGLAPARLHVIPNWSDGQSITPDDDQGRDYRDTKGIPRDAFVVLYGGNIGVAASVETIIEAVRYLREMPNLYVVIAGEGSRLEACQALASKIDSRRIVFHTPWLKGETSRVLSAANVLVLPTRGGQSLVSAPSKLVSYMLAARPVIAMAMPHSDLANLVTEQARCGWVVEPGKPDQLAEKIRTVTMMTPDELIRCGQAGRDFALENFTRDVCLPKIVRIMEAVVARE